MTFGWELEPVINLSWESFSLISMIYIASNRSSTASIALLVTCSWRIPGIARSWISASDFSLRMSTALRYAAQVLPDVPPCAVESATSRLIATSSILERSSLKILTPSKPPWTKNENLKYCFDARSPKSLVTSKNRPDCVVPSAFVTVDANVPFLR